MPVRRDVLALVPAYNEAAHIGEVVRRAREHLAVAVVDDGSADRTAAVAAEAGAEVLRQPRNAGKGAALLRGLRYGVDQGYDAVVTLDADGQHRPEEIPRFLELFDREHPDLIIGFRQFAEMPRVRRLANTVGTWLFSRAVGTRIPDNQSGYRLLSKSFIGALDFTSAGFEMEVEMIVQAVRAGRAIGWVPISTIYGDEVSHFSPVRDTIGFLGTCARTWRRVHR